MSLTSSSVFVATETLPAIGEHLQLFLSLGMHGSWGVAARVTHVHLSVEPGSPPGFAVTFEQDESTRSSVAALLRSAEPSGHRRDICVLHAEKSRLLRDMFAYAMQKYFAPRGQPPTLVQVEGLSDANRALHGAVDVAIIDHNLADGTGDSLVREVRDRFGKRCLIVGVGVEGGALRARMLDAGANIYLQKPIVLTDVLLSIELVGQQGARGTAGAA